MSTEIINDIFKSFSKGYPNGYSLGWDEDRYIIELRSRFSDWSIENQTSFDYAFCNTVFFYNNKTLPDIGLTVKFSFIHPSFIMYFSEYNKKAKFYKPTSFFCNRTANQVRNFMNAKGFSEVKVEILNVILPDVDLQLADIATIEKCLFDDYWSKP